MQTSKILTLVILFFVYLSLTSCRSVRQERQSLEEKTEIITEKTTTYRDTIFHTKPAEASLKLPLSSFKAKETDFKGDLKTFSKPLKWKQKNGNATASLEVKGDTVYISAHCDSLAIEAKIRADFESRYINTSKKEETDIKKKSGVSVFTILSLIGIALIVGFIAGIIIKFKT